MHRYDSTHRWPQDTSKSDPCVVVTIVDIKCYLGDDGKPYRVIEDKDDSKSMIGKSRSVRFYQGTQVLMPTIGHGADVDEAAAKCAEEIETNDKICGFNCFEK